MGKIPNTEHPPLVRTDFSNDAVWHELVARANRPSSEGFRAYLHSISQPEFNGLSAQALRALAADTDHTVMFVADAMTMTNPERPVLCVDLKLGRSFRIVPEELWGAENNLSLANMDFDEFANAVEEDGVFRGF